MSEEDKVGTKSLVDYFNRSSTRKNFKFFCHFCLTKMEMDLADSEANRLNFGRKEHHDDQIRTGRD